MARPQAKDYEERKEEIVRKSADLFARHGFLGTSISDIAKACRSSKSLLYHYYPSKEDVLYAVMASHIDRLAVIATESVEPGRTPRDNLLHLLRRFMVEYMGAAARQKVVLNEIDKLPRARRARIVERQREILDAMQGLLVAIDPELGKDRAQARARTMLLFGMINWTGNWFNPGGSLTPTDIADLAYELVTGEKAPAQAS